MRILRIASLVGISLIVTAAGAQTIGKPAPEIKYDDGESKNSRDDDKDKLVVQDHPGRLLVLYFWRTRNLESVEMLKDLAPLEKRYGTRGVRFIDICADSKESLEEFEKDNAVQRMQGGNFVGSGSLNMQLGAMSEPYIVIIDPRGITRWRGHPHPLDRLKDRVEMYLDRHPPPAANIKWLDARLAKAQKFVDQSELGRAYTTAKTVRDYTSESDPHYQKANALMTSIETLADNWLKNAIKHEQEDDLKEAARIVAEISVRIDDTDIARDAEREVGRMNGERELKVLIREARANSEAALLIDEAELLEDTDDYEAAREVYKKVLDEYEETDAARTAKRAMRKIDKSPAVRAIIEARRQVRMSDRLLDIAEHYTRMELYDQARDAYERLIRDYADSDAAKRAKSALRDLPASHAKRNP